MLAAIAVAPCGIPQPLTFPPCPDRSVCETRKVRTTPFCRVVFGVALRVSTIRQGAMGTYWVCTTTFGAFVNAFTAGTLTTEVFATLPGGFGVVGEPDAADTAVRPTAAATAAMSKVRVERFIRTSRV